jgi:hypothetical protein
MSRENEEILEKIIEREKNKIEKELAGEINAITESAMSRFKTFVEGLKGLSKIPFSKDVIEILAKGGNIIVTDKFLEERDTVDLKVSGFSTYYLSPAKTGKYRIILILEPLEEK